MRIRSPGFSVLYWVLTQTQEIGRICLAGIAPAHISPLSEFSQGISPGSPIKGLPSVEIGVTQPQTDTGTKCFDYIYTFLYNSFNCGTITYLKIIDGL